MKARYALWPVMIFGAVSLASACSSDGGTGSGNTDMGGSDGEGGSGANTGATTSTGATDSVGGMSTDAGASTGATAGVSGGAAGAAGAAGATGGDLCEGKNLDCPDDDNPCTEDECNPATGECGISRTGTSCDDGLFCNGDDTCNEGKCTEHQGDPCNGQTCNEGDNVCECAMDEDCPADKPGAWSECTFATTCVETGNRSRPVAKFSCTTEGACVQEAAVEIEECPRETDGLSCDDGLRCTGTDKCKAGNCDHTGNPCAGGGVDADGCWEKGTMCRSCGVGAACAAKYSCCDNSGTTASCSFGLCGIIILPPSP